MDRIKISKFAKLISSQLRLQNPNNSQSIIDNANKIDALLDSGNFEKYLVSSLEQTGVSKILKIN